jgi:xylulose-5-phosphate/fructose-6-phosphate phosphoketolase
LTRPLQPENVKPRLLGHWGKTPGLNVLYAHLNRVVRAWDLDMIFLAGPGHGGPAVVPGGIPSHVAPETPGSIHEGGELGYVLAHANGAVGRQLALQQVPQPGDRRGGAAYLGL